MTDDLDDLMKRFQSCRDPIAFNELVETLGKRLIGYLRHDRGQSYEAAEDITQETLLSIYEHADQYRGSGVVRWARRIATNLVIDRSRLRNSKILGHATVEAHDLCMESALSREPDPSERIELAEADEQTRRDAEWTLRELDKIPVKFGFVALAYAEGRSLPEIAADLGLKLPTVKSQLRLARERLTA